VKPPAAPLERPLRALPVVLALALALALWLAARWGLHAAWGLPLEGPGLVPWLLLLAAAALSLIEAPRLRPGGGRTALAWLGGAALLALGQAVLYYRVDAKDRQAGLGFAALAGGALLLWPRAGGRRAVLLGAGLLAAAAVWMIRGHGATWDLYDGPWLGQAPTLIFWAGFLGCLGGLAYGAAQSRPSLAPAEPLDRGKEWLLLALLLAAAAGLLFTWPGALPQGYWFDEVFNCGYVREKVLLEGRAPLFDGVQAGAVEWAWGAVFRAFGPGVPQLRLASAAFGLAALLPFWGLARLWLGQRWALVAALLFGVMRWPAMLDRIAFPTSFALFLALASFWSLWSAQRRGPAQGRRGLRWLLTGLLLGANLHAYTPARAVPLVCVAFLLWQQALDPAWRRTRRDWLALATGFLISAGPMLWYIGWHYGDYQAHVSQVSVFADVARSGQRLAAALGANLAKTALMFDYRGDATARHNLQFYPQVDFLTALALALALPWTLGRARRDGRGRFLWLWLGGALAASVLGQTLEAPQANRSVLAAPALALAVAWTLQELSAPLQAAFVGGAPRALRWMGLALLAGSAWLNAHELLVQWPADEATWEAFSPRASAVLWRIQAAGPGVGVFVSQLPHEYNFYGNEWGLFGRYALDPQGRYCSPLQASQGVARQDRGTPLRSALLIWGDSDAEISAAFQREFPAIPVERAPSPFTVAGLPADLYLAAEVPLAQLPPRPAHGPLPLLYRND
jgi:hypothetical protein